MQLSRDKVVGLGLAAVSLLLAMGTGLYYVAAGGSIPLAIFAWPALGFLSGLAITFFSFIEVGLDIDDEIEQFPQLVQDDIQKLRSGVFTPTFLFLAVTLIAAGLELGVLFWYSKQEASWGPVNVLLVALVVVVTALVLSLRANWFQLRRRRLSPYIFAIPTIGWLICMLVGVRFAEPIEWGGPTPLQRSQAARLENQRSPSGVGATHLAYDTVEIAGGAVTSLDCDGEGCLVVLLIAVVLMSVLASATIPHFWVVATMLLLTLMAVITLRELLVRDGVV